MPRITIGYPSILPEHVNSIYTEGIIPHEGIISHYREVDGVQKMLEFYLSPPPKLLALSSVYALQI